MISTNKTELDRCTLIFPHHFWDKDCSAWTTGRRWMCFSISIECATFLHFKLLQPDLIVKSFTTARAVKFCRSGKMMNQIVFVLSSRVSSLLISYSSGWLFSPIWRCPPGNPAEKNGFLTPGSGEGRAA